MTTSPAVTLERVARTVHQRDLPAEPVFEDLDDAEPLAERTAPPSLQELVELILKRPRQLEALIHDPRWQSVLAPRLLSVALAGFFLFGVALSLVLMSAELWPRLTPLAEFVRTPRAPLIAFDDVPHGWSVVWNGAALQLTFAYCFGLIAASGVCLPSLYFYGLLSGVNPTMLDVLMQTLKAKAVSAVALVGILPIYAAVALGLSLFDLPQWLEAGALWLGLILPFIAGLYGVNSLYLGFGRLAQSLPSSARERRGCFLQRLVLSWAAVYTAVTPVMIYTVWEALQR